MMKQILPVLAMTGVLAATGFAQSSTNVEKAVRFRVVPNAAAVMVCTGSGETPGQPQQVADAELNSSVQLNELGPNPKGLAMWNGKQLDELGPRWKWWNAAQLDELGPRWKWWNAEQLDELGPRWKWWNAAQLEELGSGRKF